MQTYNKEEIADCTAFFKEHGITDILRLYLINVAMRAKMDRKVLEVLADPKLTEFQLLKGIAYAAIPLPKETLKKMCLEPDNMQRFVEEYYQDIYSIDRKEIYQEIYESFYVQWQNNFSQLLKQTELLSDTLEFLKEQIILKESQVNKLQQELDEERERTQKEAARARNLEEERKVWEVRQEAPIPAPVLQQPSQESNLKEQQKKEGMLPGIFKKKDPGTQLIALIGNLNDDQIEEVLDGWEKGLSLKEVKKYAKPGYTVRQMQEIKKILLERKEKRI